MLRDTLLSRAAKRYKRWNCSLSITAFCLGYLPVEWRRQWFFVFFFLPRSFFRNRLLFRLFYSSVSTQTRYTRAKSPGPMQVLTGVEEVDWKGVGRPGLRPGFGSSWDDWLLQRCKDLGWLRREGWLQRGSWLHRLQRFVGGWRVAVALWLVRSCWQRLRPLASTCPEPRLQAPPIGSVGCWGVLGRFFLSFCGHPAKRLLRTFLFGVGAGLLEWVVRRVWYRLRAGLHSIEEGRWLWPQCVGHRVGGGGWYWGHRLWCLSWLALRLLCKCERLLVQVVPHGYGGSLTGRKQSPKALKMRRPPRLRRIPDWAQAVVAKGVKNATRGRRMTLKRCGG